jgi:hypothetical protein
MITGLVLAAAVVFDSISRKRAAANPKLLATAHHRPPTRTKQEAS